MLIWYEIHFMLVFIAFLTNLFLKKFEAAYWLLSWVKQSTAFQNYKYFDQKDKFFDLMMDNLVFFKYLTFNWSLASSRQLEHWQWKKYLFFNISLLCSVVFNKSLSKYVHLILEKSSTFEIDLITSSLPSKGLLNQVLLGALKWSKKFLNTFLERDLPSIK